MKTTSQIKAEITDTERAYEHVLTGSVATIVINAPRALMQLDAETKLNTLHWVLGTRYKSRLKGVDR